MRKAEDVAEDILAATIDIFGLCEFEKDVPDNSRAELKSRIVAAIEEARNR